MGLPRRKSKIRHPLHTQLIPDRRQIVALVELNLVGHDAGTQLLVGRILQVPAGLRLLHVAAHDRMLVAALNCAPHLEILHSVSIGVLARPLPGDHVGTERGEAQLEDIVGGDGRDDVTDRGIDDGYPADERFSQHARPTQNTQHPTYFSGDAQA